MRSVYDGSFRITEIERNIWKDSIPLESACSDL